jgi:hypothetical protein
MPELVVDFNDQQSIAGAIPQAELLIRQAEQRAAMAVEEAAQAHERASDAEVEIQRLRAVLQTLERLDEGGAPPSPHASEEGSRNKALRVVIIINGPTTIAEVAEHMPEFSSKTVSWALWKLADEGAIQRLGHGRYAPLGYVPGQPTMNYFHVLPGMPAPDEAQIMHAIEEANAAAKAARA